MRELEVGVAGHPKSVEALNVHPSEERDQICADHLLERNERVSATEWDPARQALWNFDPREPHRFGRRIEYLHRQRQREIGAMAERVARIDAEGRPDGKEL